MPKATPAPAPIPAAARFEIPGLPESPVGLDVTVVVYVKDGDDTVDSKPEVRADVDAADAILAFTTIEGLYSHRYDTATATG